MSHQYETAQREFDKDGFVALRQFGHGEELADLMANVDRFIRDVVPNMPPEQVYYEDKNNRATRKQIQLMGDYDPYFRDLLVHHAMTIHRADGNHSQDRSRRALGFVYYSQRAKEDVSTLQAYQRKLDEEMASAGRI